MKGQRRNRPSSKKRRSRAIRINISILPHELLSIIFDMSGNQIAARSTCKQWWQLLPKQQYLDYFYDMMQYNYANVVDWVLSSRHYYLVELDAGFLYVDDAARYGSLETLIVLLKYSGCYITNETFGYACESGNIEMLSYLYNRDHIQHSQLGQIYRSVAIAGHLHVLDWLYNHYGMPYLYLKSILDETTTDSADILEWFRMHGLIG